MRTLDEGIRIRADEKTVRLIDYAAELYGMTRSRFVREAALREARRIIQGTSAGLAAVGTAAYPPTGNGGAQAGNQLRHNFEQNGIAPRTAEQPDLRGYVGAARS